MRFIPRLWVFLLIIGVAQFYGEETLRAKGVDLGEIIITNRRSRINSTEATENVTIISEDAVKQLLAQNLGEALKYIAGLDIDPRQGFGRSTSITIQGCDSRQVRVMIDGILLNSQIYEQVDFSRLPLQNVARIEVIKGAASSLWGSALGGVINIITKDTGTTAIPKGSVTTSFAGFRTRKESFDLSGKVAGFGYYLFSDYMESGGKGPKDDVLEKRAFTKLSYDSKEMGKITASFGCGDADTNSGEYPGGSFQAQWHRSRYGKVGWQLKSGDTDIKIDLKHSRQNITTKFYLSVDDQEPFSTVRTSDALYQFSLNSAVRPREKDLLVLGVDLDWDTIKSNTYLDKAKSVKLQAPYANYTLKSEPWDFNFGLRYDRNSEFGEEVSPSFGVVYHVKNIPETLLRLGASRAFNTPLLIWKYNQNSLWAVIPNPNIGAERAWVYELGLETKPIPSIWVKFSLYRADVSDALAWAEDELNQQYMKNFEKFRRQGIELQFKVNFSQELTFLAAAAFNDIEDRITKQTVRGGGKPRQSFNVGIEYKNKNGLNCSLRGYYGRWNEPPDSQPNDRKMLLDFKITREFKNLIFFLNIYNLTNSKYWADYFFPVPERYFEGGITIRW